MITQDTKMKAVVTYSDYDHSIVRVVLCTPEEVSEVLMSERIKATWLGQQEGLDLKGQLDDLREDGETDADIVNRIYGEWEYDSHPTIVEVAQEPIAVTLGLQKLAAE